MFNLLKLAYKYSEEPGTCLLMSGSNFDSAKKSYLFLFPREHIWGKGNKIFRSGINKKVEEFTFKNPWDGLKELIGDLNEESDAPKWVGYFGYEMGAFSDVIINLKKSPIYDFYFMTHEVVVEFDHKTKKLESFSLEGDERAKLKKIESEKSYTEKILAIKDMILSGDVYQVNLSQKFDFVTKKMPFQIYYELFLKNPAPFSAFLNFSGFAIISSSPERLLQKRGNVLETRPIKGTAPRGKTISEDKENREKLLNSEKERAELLMITDLMRNDLAKVSEPGSVVVDEVWKCEEYDNVFHLLSIIKAKARSSLHPLDIFRAVFPGGSIVGCPKIKAMEIINNLEKFPRGIYTGSIGYFSDNGDFDFNIAIRTLLWKEGIVDCRLGGAIVSDSDPKREFEETLHKGKSIFDILL